MIGIKRILSVGYNGAPNGFSDEDFPWNRDGNTLETKYPFVCHGELNAIMNYRGSRKDFDGATIYVTLFPCNECSKAIVQSGIKHIIYLSDKYKDHDSNKASKIIYDKCGITYKKLKSSKKIDIDLERED